MIYLFCVVNKPVTAWLLLLAILLTCWTPEIVAAPPADANSDPKDLMRLRTDIMKTIAGR